MSIPNPKLVITTKCDKTRYKIAEPPGYVLAVTYKHLNGYHNAPINQEVLEVPILRSYLHVTDTDVPPETENGAFWYVRAVYEHIKRPVWFWFAPTSTLIVFPAPSDDGSALVVEFGNSSDGLPK